MNQSPSRLKVVCALVGLLICYGVVGRMDYEDELAQEKQRPTRTMLASQECSK